MGEFLLGALLGFNQSFERFHTLPDSWERVSDQVSFYQADAAAGAAAVHSSAFGLRTVAHSTGGAAQFNRFRYDAPEDAPRIAFPEVATHPLRATVWARAGDAPSSGQARWRLDGDGAALSAPIGHHDALQRYEAATVVGSQAGLPAVSLERVNPAAGPVTTHLDDVLTRVDAIALHPEWSLEQRQSLIRRQHRTQSGRLHTFVWDRFFAFDVPLRWVDSAQAALINWWWELQLDLAFTLDSSDAGAVYVCRITNPTQPVGRRMRPYRDLWRGRLALESVNDGSLVF